MVGVLWSAAAGKAIQIISEPVLPDRWFWTVVVEVELLLGLLLILGRRRRWAWTLGAFTFLAFAVIAGGKAYRGEPDCGCFGVVAVNPWITMGIDLSLAALLIAMKPAAAVIDRGLWASRPGKIGAASTLLVGAGVALSVTLTPPGLLSADGAIDGQGSHVVLEPSEWLSKPFPLMPYLPTETGLDEGTWEIVLARPGCPHCISFLEQWEPQDGVQHRALISLDSPDNALRQAVPDAMIHTLRQDRRWYADVPLTLQLTDGVVTRIGSSTVTQPNSPSEQSTPASMSDDTTNLQGVVWFDADGRVDLGYIQPGSTHTLAYRLDAPPGRPLTVHRIHSECKCTTITESPERVAPGSEGVITMQFIAADKPLDYNQGVLIQTDHTNPDIADRRLVVTARIGLPLAITPQEVVLGQLSGGGEELPHVTIINDGEEAIRLIYAVAGSPGITAQVPRAPIEPGQSVDVPVITQPDRWDGLATRIRIPTTCAEQPNLFIIVRPPSP